jgi:glyoxylase-like metal-dependent hydrolase (beta-lactamase superfamily II)
MAAIEPAELDERLGSDGPLVLDIRHEEEFADSHIPGSENVDVYDELKTGSEDAKDALADLPSDEEIVTVCALGGVSQTATEVLRDLGYEARTLVDGMAGWSRVHRHAPVDADLDGRLVQVARPGTGCLSHVLVSDGEAAVFDASQYAEIYGAVLDEHDAALIGVFDTHAHADHVSGGRFLAERYDVPYHLHEADSGALSEYAPLADGDEIAVGGRALGVVHTPGHTPGSVSLRVGDGLLSGDTLFIASVGRPDLEDDDEAAVREAARDLHASLERLRDLPADTLVLPGHFTDQTDRPLATTLGGLAADNDLFATRDREAFVDAVVAGLSDTPANYERIKRINRGQEAADGEAADLELGPNNCAAN